MNVIEVAARARRAFNDGDPILVYISGPIEGVVDNNVPKFDMVQMYFQHHHANVYNPSSTPLTEAPADYIARNLSTIAAMRPGKDVLILLPGYLASIRSDAEVAASVWVGLEYAFYPGDVPVYV